MGQPIHASSQKGKPKNVNFRGGIYQIGGGIREKLASDGTGIIFNNISELDLDWFAIIEHQLNKTGSIPQIPGYFVFARGAQGGAGGVCLYFKLKYKFRVTKVRTAKGHNLLWAKISGGVGNASKDIYICAAYCRTATHFDEVNSFFGILAHDVLMFSELGEVIVVGDFNARLGEITGDKTPKGDWATNGNANMFRSFLSATNMILLNSKLAYGKPTFVRPSKTATSIIDFALVSNRMAEKIGNFKVDILDTGSYVAHNTAISFQHPTSIPTPHPTPTHSYYYEELTGSNCEAFFNSVLSNLDFAPKTIDSAFHNLISAFNCAQDILKRKCKGSGKPRNKQIPRITELRRHLNRWARKLLGMRSLPADCPQVVAARGTYDRLRAELQRVERAVRQDHWEKQLARLDKLDFKNRTKAFWKMVSKLRSDKISGVSFAIKNLKGVISSSREEFLENWTAFYQRLYQPLKLASNLRTQLLRINKVRARNSDATGILDRDLERKEFDAAIAAQRLNSAPGFDSILPLMLTNGPKKLQAHIFGLLKSAFKLESGLDPLKSILICPI